MAGQDAGEGLVDGPEQRVDRAVALGRGLPLVVARGDDDRAAAVGVRAGRAPSSARDGACRRVGRRSRGGRRRRRPSVTSRSVTSPLGPPTSCVKCRSSRRRSSAPDFQIAYSSESREGLRGRRDDVRVAAHRRPFARPVGRVDDDARPRGGRRVAVEDPDLVVVQVDVVELRVERPERLAQRGVERVDRAVSVGGGVEDLAVDLDLDGRLGEELARRRAARRGRCSRRSGTARRSRPGGAGSAARSSPRRPRTRGPRSRAA